MNHGEMLGLMLAFEIKYMIVLTIHAGLFGGRTMAYFYESYQIV